MAFCDSGGVSYIAVFYEFCSHPQVSHLPSFLLENAGSSTGVKLGNSGLGGLWSLSGSDLLQSLSQTSLPDPLRSFRSERLRVPQALAPTQELFPQEPHPQPF